MEVVLYETDVEIYSEKKSSTLSYLRFHQNEEIIFYDRRMSRKNLKAAAFLQSAKVCEAPSLCALPSDRASEAPSLCALPSGRISEAPSLYASLTGQTSEAPSPCALHGGSKHIYIYIHFSRPTTYNFFFPSTVIAIGQLVQIRRVQSARFLCSIQIRKNNRR